MRRTTSKLFLLIFITMGVNVCKSITTTSYDKPDAAKIGAGRVNATLTPSERQKRLLPYTNFYSNPNPIRNRPLYEPEPKYTPFLESNALPGPFQPVPLQTTPPRIKLIQLIPITTKNPNFATIYDKLSQLKLQNRPVYQQEKTYVHTYTPTNIEVPTPEAPPPPRYITLYPAPRRPSYILVKPPKQPINNEIYEAPPLNLNHALPPTITHDNIDNSIKTLVKILAALRQKQKTVVIKPKPIIVAEPPDYDESEPEDTTEGGTPGTPGIDYPALSTIPPTSFNCKTQRYKGFFGDPDTNCQVWHYCDLNGGQASFLCPNGTIFSQVALTCDWWYNVKCSTTAQLYVLNERLYKYIIPLAPKFPEDYSGPLVDKYLALKYQELEEKMRKEKKGRVPEPDTSHEEEPAKTTLESIENNK